MTLNRILSESSVSFVQTIVAHLFVVRLVVQIKLALSSKIPRPAGSNKILNAIPVKRNAITSVAYVEAIVPLPHPLLK